MQIYIHRNNQQLGPFTEDQIKAQLASGVLSLQDHVWWEGQTTWMQLGQSPLAATLPPPSPGFTPVVPGPLSGISGGPHANSNIPETSKLAIWALVCGCVSFLCGLAFVPAIILGHMGLSETRKNPAIPGRGMALAGLILGYLYMILFILVVIISFLIALGKQVKVNEARNSHPNTQEITATNSPDQNATNSAPGANP